jgi:hypothetical protein
MWVKGMLGIVPELATKIILNEEGTHITLSNNVNMLKKWAIFGRRRTPSRCVGALEL